jgi:hypothetical protein
VTAWTRSLLFVAGFALILAACNGAATQAPSVTAPSTVASAVPATPAQSTAAETSVPSDTGAGDSSPAPIPDSPVAGIVTAVDSSGLDQVRGFTLLTNEGETIQFTMGQLENGDEFPPGHLKEHQATAAPVLVFFRQQNGELVVYRIEDAG